MDKQEIIEKTVLFVKETLAGAEGGHDWWHIHRVVETSKSIAEKEGADVSLVELSALVHDYGDYKFHEGNEEEGMKKVREFLTKVGLEKSITDKVIHIVESVSFKGGFGKEPDSIEAIIVQDADRLDAIGAVGIGRAFAYGGNKGRIMYDPNNSPKNFKSFEEYKDDNGPTINHLYEKLLLLKDKMQTDSGRKMAEERHRFMELFLEQFYAEWSR